MDLFDPTFEAIRAALVKYAQYLKLVDPEDRVHDVICEDLTHNGTITWYSAYLLFLRYSTYRRPRRMMAQESPTVEWVSLGTLDEIGDGQHEHMETQAEIHMALKHLNPQQVSVFVLHLVGHTSDEIGQILGVSGQRIRVVRQDIYDKLWEAYHVHEIRE